MSNTLADVPATAAVKGGATPYLNIDGAVKAAQFYQKALGAEVAAMHPADEKGRTMHIHLYVNGSSVMIGDFYPEYGHPAEKPAAFSVVLAVDDIHRWHQRAVDAGASVVQPVTEMFWGDLYGMVKDPFGVSWGFNQPKG